MRIKTMQISNCARHEVANCAEVLESANPDAGMRALLASTYTLAASLVMMTYATKMGL